MSDVLNHRVERNCLQWQLLAAYMARRKNISRLQSSVSVVFKTQLEAEEFQKLLTSASPRKES